YIDQLGLRNTHRPFASCERQRCCPFTFSGMSASDFQSLPPRPRPRPCWRPEMNARLKGKLTHFLSRAKIVATYFSSFISQFSSRFLPLNPEPRTLNPDSFNFPLPTDNFIALIESQRKPRFPRLQCDERLAGC